jgi:hypothetical protein
MSIVGLIDRPIAFQRSYVRLGIGVTAALMLSQAVYWALRTKSADGWFYKDQTEWEEETGLGRREQETARKKLGAAGFLEEQKKGVPCRLFYRVNIQALEDALLALDDNRQARMAEPAKLETTRVSDDLKPVPSLAESAKLERRNPPSKEGGIRQAITENTQRLQTETTNTNTHTACAAVEHAFERFWLAGMRKVEKKNALAAFKRALGNMDADAFADKLIDDVKKRIEAGQFGFDRLHPTSYLNGERWQDDIIDESQAQKNPQGANRAGEASGKTTFGTTGIISHERLNAKNYRAGATTDDDLPDYLRGGA